jgi:cell division GTPase FtsZ
MKEKKAGVGADFVVDVPDIPMPSTEGANSEIVRDECSGAFKLAFVGAGQGGSRIAESFWKLGYRRVCCVNTNGQDLAAIQIPEANKLVMDIGTGGAGKDPTKGETAAKQHYEDIYDLMRRSFGREFDRILVCIGAGGGTGGGAMQTLVSIAHDIAKSFKVETDDGRPSVGVISALPRLAEGAKVNANAQHVMESLFSMVGKERGKMGGRTISPLIVVDNERINRIYPGLTVADFWGVANRSVSALFHLFNSIAVQDSEFTTFDRADLEDILDSGVVSFGACPLKEWKLSTDISHAIRDNLKNNVLVGGFDISQARTAGCIFIGSGDVLDSIPQEHLEHGFEMLSRIMRQGGTLHRGIYKGSKSGLVVYSALGELGRPEERMTEIARAAKAG